MPSIANKFRNQEIKPQVLTEQVAHRSVRNDTGRNP